MTRPNFELHNQEETETIKAKFLVPVGTLVAALAAEHTSAAVAPPNSVIEPHHSADLTASRIISVLEPQNLTVQVGKDAYGFVLKRAERGQLMAYHSSHSSHSSHYSHRSSSS